MMVVWWESYFGDMMEKLKLCWFDIFIHKKSKSYRFERLNFAD